MDKPARRYHDAHIVKEGDKLEQTNFNEDVQEIVEFILHRPQVGIGLAIFYDTDNISQTLCVFPEWLSEEKTNKARAILEEIMNEEIKPIEPKIKVKKQFD